MASYAPLLTNVNPEALQWTPDLIGYDALRSYGSPSYYAQVMFSSYLGDEKPASTIEGGGSRFFYSATESRSKKQLYLKLVNGSTNAQAVQIALPGVSIGTEAKCIALHADATTATNTIDQPTNIVPVESTLPVTGGTLQVQAPPLSIQVLVFDLR
jgi:alpha-L-arabinofuranosidase